MAPNLRIVCVVCIHYSGRSYQ